MTPPHSTSAERAVLGACLTWPECVDEVADYVEAGDFYHEAHELMWEGIVRLSARGVTPDAVTLPDDLRAHGTLERAGGLTGVQSVLDQPTRAGVVNYAREVADEARVRRVIQQAQQTVEAGMRGDYGDPSEFCDDAEARTMEAARGRRVVDAVPMATVVKDTVGWLNSIPKDGVDFGVPTGIRELDDLTSGLQPGDLTIVAASTSVGKTSFATWLALGAKCPAVIFSLEQGQKQIALRLIAGESGMPVYQIRAPRFWGHEGAGRILDAAERLHRCRVWLDDRAGLTPLQIRQRVRRLKRTAGIGLVVVDYLQICRPSLRRKNQGRERDVADMSAEFKTLAKEAGLPVVLLSQLSRDGTKADKPELYHLRDSGAVEQDADSVIFIQRPDRGKVGKDQPEQAKLLLRKNRNGPLGEIDLTWDPVRMRFTDPSEGPAVVEQPTPDPMADIVEGEVF